MGITEKISRRRLVQSAGVTIGLVGAAALVAACGSSAPASPTAASSGSSSSASAPTATAASAAAATAAPTTAAAKPASATPTAAAAAAPQSQAVAFGGGTTSITMWVQDFGAIVNAFKAAAKSYSDKQSNVKVTVMPIAYGDLQTKILPSIAAGDEADVIFGYTLWYIATDLSKLFLPLNDYFGGTGALEKIIFPNVLTMLNPTMGKLYYLPYMSGQNGAAVSVNVNDYKAKKIDYMSFKSIDDVISAGKELTVMDGSSVKKAGLSMTSNSFLMITSWILQQGGTFYDEASGKWNLATPEGQLGAQMLYDMIWKYQTTSYDIYKDDNTGWIRGLLDSQVAGSWTVQEAEGSQESFQADAVPTPTLANAKSNLINSDALAVVALSKRLPSDQTKLNYTVGLVKEMFTPDSLLSITDVYSGTLCSSQVYEDPRVDKTKFGPVSKRIATNIWPRARYIIGHIANTTPVYAELDKGLRKQVSLQQALQNADTYLNQQEIQARQRLGLK